MEEPPKGVCDIAGLPSDLHCAVTSAFRPLHSVIRAISVITGRRSTSSAIVSYMYNYYSNSEVDKYTQKKSPPDALILCTGILYITSYIIQAYIKLVSVSKTARTGYCSTIILEILIKVKQTRSKLLLEWPKVWVAGRRVHNVKFCAMIWSLSWTNFLKHSLNIFVDPTRKR